MKKIFAAMMLLAPLFANSTTTVAGNIVQVGVLDRFSRDFLPEGKRFIIPLFQKDGAKWTAIDSVLPRRQWTIAFDGRTLGTISAETAESQPLNGIHNLQDPAGKLDLPGKPMRKTDSGKLIGRPFVLVTGGQAVDPDDWKRRALPPDVLDNLFHAFRSQYPDVTNCLNHNAPPRPWNYKNSDIRVLNSYGSRRGDFIAEIKLAPDRCGELSNDPFEPQYFGLPSRGEPHRMSVALTLIDAGDYDGDGRSELVFSDASAGGDDANSDGYSIWGSDLRRLAQRIWFYH